MSDVYGKGVELLKVSDELLNARIPNYQSDKKIISTRRLFDTVGELTVFLSRDSLDRLNNFNLKLIHGLFKNKVAADIDNNMSYEYDLPNYLPREDDRIYLANYVGQLFTNDRDFNEELGNVLPFMFEYYFLDRTSNNPTDRFENRNLSILKGEAKRIKSAWEDYHNNYDSREYGSFTDFISQGLTDFYSYDAALQLINLYKKDPAGVIGLVNEMINSRASNKDILENAGITLGYDNLRESIAKKKVR